MNIKVISTVVALAMLLSSFSISFAASDSVTIATTQDSTYKDVSGHWAAEAISKWSGYGVVSGHGGYFRPNDSITRGEIACILDNMMVYQTSSKNSFSDLKVGKFYTNAVLKANAAGIMIGDGFSLLRPTDKITREEAAVMFSKAFAVTEGSITNTVFKDAETVASWARTSVFGLESKGYIKGSSEKYNPKANITRAETVAIINNIVKAYYTKAGSYTDNVEGTAVIKVPNVILKGSISENLIIAEGVGQGDATLDALTVKGNTVVRGGGENSIHITGNSNITNITIEKISDKLRIVVAEGNTVKEIDIAKGEEIIITGSVGTLEIGASNAIVYATAANISSAKVTGHNSTIIVNKESKIDHVSVDNIAENTTIKTEKSAVVGTVTSNAKIAISGEGTLKKVVLNEGANNSSVSTPNTQITVAQSVTGVTAGGGVAIAAGTTTTNNSTGNGVTVVPPTSVSAGGNGGDNGNSVTVSAITVTPTTITLTAGGATGTITATINPSNATNKNVIWLSSNTNIATVDNGGVVTPLTVGTTTISAISADDVTKIAKTTVTVIPDTTAPVISNGTVENLGTIDGTTAVLKYQATQEAGTVKYYYLVQDAGTSAPDINAIKMANRSGRASGNPTYYQINLTWLEAGENYSAYIVMEDASGNTSNILTITGINPYSNVSLIKLGTPSVNLSPNNSGTGGLVYTITASNSANDNDIKEYSLVIASLTSLTTPIFTLAVSKNNLSGVVTLANGITAGNSYVARVQAIVTDGNASYQNSDYSANTAAATAQALSTTEPTMQVSYVSNFNKDSVDRSLQFSFSGSDDALASSITIDTTKLKIMIGNTVHQLSNYTKATTGLRGTYQLLYGDIPSYVKIFLTDEDYDAITSDANFTSATGINKLVADLGWANINGIVSGQASEETVSFSRNLTITNNSDEYIAKYQLSQNYHRTVPANKIIELSYFIPEVTFYSELIIDSGIEPTIGCKITKSISTTSSSISFSESDVWTRLSTSTSPINFAPTDNYYKVTAADTDQVMIGGIYYRVAQGVAGRLNSMLTIKYGDTIVDNTNAFMFKFGLNGTLEAIKVVDEVSIEIDLVGHFAPVGGVPIYLDSTSAKLTITGGNTIGNITVINAPKDYFERVWVTGGSKVGDIILIDGVKLRVSGYGVMTKVGNVSGTGAYTVAIDVDSTNMREVSVGNVALGNTGTLDLYQNDANDLLPEFFTIGDVTATTSGAAIIIPNSTNINCNPYGWFMKFNNLGNTVTFKSSNDIYTPPTSDITFSGNSIIQFRPTIQYGVFIYYDTEIQENRFFFTDAVINESDLSDDSKTFTFSAIDSITHKSILVVK